MNGKGLQERFRTIDGPTAFKNRYAGDLLLYYTTHTENAPLFRRRRGGDLWTPAFQREEVELAKSFLSETVHWRIIAL